MNQLMRRYRCGVRHASDVVVCLDLLANRARFEELSALLLEALDAARPVPQVLWRWAAEYVEFLNPPASKRLLDAQLAGSCRAAVDVEAAAKSGDYLIALLAAAVESLAGGRHSAYETWHALAMPVVKAALKNRERGFHYDHIGQLALDTLPALASSDRRQAECFAGLVVHCQQLRSPAPAASPAASPAVVTSHL
jgi:hypothetical protein